MNIEQDIYRASSMYETFNAKEANGIKVLKTTTTSIILTRIRMCTPTTATPDVP